MGLALLSLGLMCCMAIWVVECDRRCCGVCLGLAGTWRMLGVKGLAESGMASTIKMGRVTLLVHTASARGRCTGLGSRSYSRCSQGTCSRPGLRLQKTKQEAVTKAMLDVGFVPRRSLRHEGSYRLGPAVCAVLAMDLRRHSLARFAGSSAHHSPSRRWCLNAIGCPRCLLQRPNECRSQSWCSCPRQEA